jgi:tRNA (cmo5U34)-methyltransferase
MSNVGDNIKASRGNWKFSGEVTKTFDDHVSKSVPMYFQGHDLICDLSDFFVKDGSTVLELGCSTGTLTLKLAEHNIEKNSASFIGIDVVQDMINVSNKKLSELPHLSNSVEFLVDNALSMEMPPSDLIVCYYTVQFINPSQRQDLINKIYQSLNWGGALVMFEKVRGGDARFQDIFTSLYTDYKLRIGYTPEDIIGKSQSLKGVLEPFSTQGNIDMLTRAGFSDINTLQKYICFEGFLAIK